MDFEIGMILLIKTRKFVLFLVFCFINMIEAKSQVISIPLPDSLYVNSENTQAKIIKTYPFSATSYDIVVSTQQDFEKLQQNLNLLLAQNIPEIRVLIADGHYFYKENQFSIKDCSFPKTNVLIEGSKETILTGIGNDYHIPDNSQHLDEKHYQNCYLTENDKELDFWSEVKFSKDTIQIADSEKKICRLKLAVPDETLERDFKPGWVVQITEWYYSRYCKVIQISDGWLYFSVDASALLWNPNSRTLRINSDFGFGKKMPRYRIFNKEITERPAYESSTSTWLNLNNAKLGCLAIRNITFLGNKNSNALMNITNSNNIEITGCSFYSLHGGIVNAKGTNNFIFMNNYVNGCQGYGIYCDHSSNTTQIVNNTFDDVCLSLRNLYAIKCEGRDFLIKGNKIHNFGYGGIGVGLAYNRPVSNIISGIVEENELWYDQAMVKHPEDNNLMDSGAIYTWTINDDVKIRYNYVHDYNGMYLNRGIFCDDGSKNLTIYGNTVVRIRNSYSIDLRTVNNVSNKVPNHNTNNKIFYNLMDGIYRFQGRIDCRDNCYSASNFILSKKDTLPPTNINTIKNRIEDVHLNYSQKENLYTLQDKDAKELNKYKLNPRENF